MNDIFWDLINKRDVATFIDNVLVGMEIKKRAQQVGRRDIEEDRGEWPVCKARVVHLEGQGGKIPWGDNVTTQSS